MHKDHGIFERGLVQYRMIKLTFFAGEPDQKQNSQCAPLYFSSGRADKNELDCYYFWDFEAKTGSNFLALEPSKIVAMELTEESYNLGEIRRSRGKTDYATPSSGPSDI